MKNDREEERINEQKKKGRRVRETARESKK